MPLRSLLLTLTLLLAPLASAQDKTLTVEKLFTLPAPEGYTWSKVRDMEDGGVKATIYLASREGAAARVILIVQQPPAPTDAHRQTTVKAHYNAMVQNLKDGGFTNLKGSRPPLDPPIPDRAAFIMFGQKEGKEFAFHSTTVFGKRAIYLFQTSAESQDEVLKLAKVAEGLKEPPQ